jgi:hypothetical protein
MKRNNMGLNPKLLNIHLLRKLHQGTVRAGVPPRVDAIFYHRRAAAFRYAFDLAAKTKQPLSDG